MTRPNPFVARSRFFPPIKPSSRSYTPGTYPQTEFVAQNGAKTVLRYGNKKVDAKLTLGFTNITENQASDILNLYEEVNSDYDYIEFNTGDALAGMILPDTTNMNLFDKFREIEGFEQLTATHQPLNENGKLSILDYDSDIFSDPDET